MQPRVGLLTSRACAEAVLSRGGRLRSVVGCAVTTAERFWAKVDKSGDCWIWTGAVIRKRGGYGASTHLACSLGREARRRLSSPVEREIADQLAAMDDLGRGSGVPPDRITLA